MDIIHIYLYNYMAFEEGLKVKLTKKKTMSQLKNNCSWVGPLGLKALGWWKKEQLFIFDANLSCERCF